MDYLPLFARLSTDSCLVVGGGQVGLRKTRQLLRAGARVEVVATEFTADLRTLANEADIRLTEAAFEPQHIGDHLLVIAATNDSAVNAVVAAAAADAKRFCNVVDDLKLSAAIMPAVVDRSPLLIAVSTGGESPVMATRIRQQIEKLLPQTVAGLVSFAAEWRTAVKESFADVDGRRRFWQDTLDGPIARQVLRGETDNARQAMQQSLAGQAPRTGEAWIVGAGPGDPELLTLKAARLLGSADVILHDRLVAKPILDLARKDAEFISVGKRGGERSISQQSINELLVSKVMAGKRVCRLKGGDPFIFGRGGEEIEALEAAGLPWQVVPGITAASGCAAELGLPLTHRSLARSVVLLTAFTADDAEPDWRSLGRNGQTVVFYMVLSRLATVCTSMLAAGHSPELPALLVANGTTGQQQSIRGTLATLVEQVSNSAVGSPTILIIGEVVKLATGLTTDPAADHVEVWSAPAAVNGR